MSVGGRPPAPPGLCPRRGRSPMQVGRVRRATLLSRTPAPHDHALCLSHRDPTPWPQAQAAPLRRTLHAASGVALGGVYPITPPAFPLSARAPGPGRPRPDSRPAGGAPVEVRHPDPRPPPAARCDMSESEPPRQVAPFSFLSCCASGPDALLPAILLTFPPARVASCYAAATARREGCRPPGPILVHVTPPSAPRHSSPFPSRQGTGPDSPRRPSLERPQKPAEDPHEGDNGHWDNKPANCKRIGRRHRYHGRSPGEDRVDQPRRGKRRARRAQSCTLRADAPPLSTPCAPRPPAAPPAPLI